MLGAHILHRDRDAIASDALHRPALRGIQGEAKQSKALGRENQTRNGLPVKTSNDLNLSAATADLAGSGRPNESSPFPQALL